MAQATVRPAQPGMPSLARRAMSSDGRRDIELVIGLDFAWLDDPERERLWRSFGDLLAHDSDEEDPLEGAIDDPAHFGPTAPAVAAARDIEAEHLFDLYEGLMMPSSWPWARHRRSRLHLAR